MLCSKFTGSGAPNNSEWICWCPREVKLQISLPLGFFFSPSSHLDNVLSLQPSAGNIDVPLEGPRPRVSDSGGLGAAQELSSLEMLLLLVQGTY